MVLAYNNVIVSVRNNFATDPALAAIDHWMLHGHSVSQLTHWALQTFPLSFFKSLEFIYFGMFLQIGATLILLALCDGRTQALQFVGTILTSYYLALIIFYIWPAQGPYTLCPAHFSRFPASLQSYNIQKTLIPHALALWRHEPISRISTDYFIAFPCMHIVPADHCALVPAALAENDHCAGGIRSITDCRNPAARNALCNRYRCRPACRRRCHCDHTGPFRSPNAEAAPALSRVAQ